MSWGNTLLAGQMAALAALLLWVTWAKRRKAAAAYAGLDRLRANAGLPRAVRTDRPEKLSLWLGIPCAVLVGPALILWDDHPHLFPGPVRAAVAATGWELTEQLAVVGAAAMAGFGGREVWRVCRDRFPVARFGRPRAAPVARDGGFLPFPDPVLTPGTVDPTYDLAYACGAAFAAWLLIVAGGGLPLTTLLFLGAWVPGFVSIAARRAWALPGANAAFLTDRGAVTARRRVAWADADRVLFAPVGDDRRVPKLARGGAALEVDRDGLSERFLLTPAAAAVAEECLAAVPAGRLLRGGESAGVPGPAGPA